MAVTAISRDQGINVNIVRLTTTDSLAVVGGSAYLTAQNANITALNNGQFKWLSSDAVLVNASDGRQLFSFNGLDFTTLVGLPGEVIEAIVPMTAAQFNTMYTTPVNLLPAPGANRIILVDKAYAQLTYGSAQFTGGGVVALQYDLTANGAGVPATTTVAAASFTGATASTSYLFNGALTAAVFSTTVNKGIYISNQTAVFAAGNSTFNILVFYRIVPTV